MPTMPMHSGDRLIVTWESRDGTALLKTGSRPNIGSMGSIAAYCLASDVSFLRELRQRPRCCVALACAMLLVSAIVGFGGISNNPFDCAGTIAAVEDVENERESLDSASGQGDGITGDMGWVQPDYCLIANLVRPQSPCPDLAWQTPLFSRGPPTPGT